MFPPSSVLYVFVISRKWFRSWECLPNAKIEEESFQIKSQKLFFNVRSIYGFFYFMWTAHHKDGGKGQIIRPFIQSVIPLMLKGTEFVLFFTRNLLIWSFLFGSFLIRLRFQDWMVICICNLNLKIIQIRTIDSEYIHLKRSRVIELYLNEVSSNEVSRLTSFGFIIWERITFALGLDSLTFFPSK